MDLTGNVLTDKEKNSFISEQFQGYAVRWYTNGRYNVTTNEHFKNSLFEGCYGKLHTEKYIRNQVEDSKYQGKVALTVGEYVIQRVERSKHLTLTIKQHKVVRNFAHHFHDSKFASKTLGVKNMEETLTLLAQDEHMFRTEYRNKTNFILREEKKNSCYDCIRVGGL